MIRYAISYQQLEQKIKAHKDSWLRRAKQRTEKFRAAGKYEEASNIWSEIKQVYFDVQHHKCVFCERQMASSANGLIEMDVEHFRPKNNVSPWTPNSQGLEGVNLTTPTEGAGYYLLPYHLFNYAASCKPCNSTLKSDYFPIAAEYQMDGDSPVVLNESEKPYLIYPIGDIDQDPQALIGFIGVQPYAKSQDLFNQQRALVTIDLFKLDSFSERKELFKQRAIVIQLLWGMLAIEQMEIVEQCTLDSAQHANCARSFVALYHQDKAAAERIFESSKEFTDSRS